MDESTAGHRPAPDYVGLHEDAARERAAAETKPFRVVQRDDEHFIITMDYVERRVNVVVRNGAVESAEYY
jgi:hypothetical protein